VACAPFKGQNPVFCRGLGEHSIAIYKFPSDLMTSNNFKTEYAALLTPALLFVVSVPTQLLQNCSHFNVSVGVRVTGFSLDVRNNGQPGILELGNEKWRFT
jgi:hypothetical protein